MDVWPRLLLVACSEYDVKGGTEAALVDSAPTESASTDSPTDADTLPTCPEPEVSRVSVAADSSCAESPVDSPLEARLVWEALDGEDIVTAPVVGRLADTNGDGVLTSADPAAVVTVTREFETGSTELVVLAGTTGSVLWSVDLENPDGRDSPSPVVVDADGDKDADIIVWAESGVYALEGDTGAVLWRAEEYLVSLEGALALGDADGDGSPETVAVSYRAAIYSEGGRRRLAEHWIDPPGWSLPAFADLALDGAAEIHSGGAACDVDGNSLWENGEEDGFVAVADFDDDGLGDVVVSAWGGIIRLQGSDGAVVWSRDAIEGETGGPPAIADVDGDGRPEIVVSDNLAVYLLAGDGREIWRQPVAQNSSFSGASFHDIDGDGYPEVLYLDQLNFFVFDGRTGEPRLAEGEHDGATGSEYPVPVDIDGDGDGEIVVVRGEGGIDDGLERGVALFESALEPWAPGPRTWPQHGYWPGAVTDDGEVVANPTWNWLAENTFRAAPAPPAAAGKIRQNAVPIVTDTCLVECDRGRVRLVVVVANEGMGRLPAGLLVTVSSGGTVLGEQETLGGVSSGNSTPGMVFELDATGIVDGDVTIAVDGAAAVEECNEEDNLLKVPVACP